MPTISVKKDDLLQLLGKEHTVEELESLLDCVKGELKEYDRETGELKIELKDTNSPDLWCPEGIARQIRFKTEDRDYRSLLRLNETTPEKRIFVDEDGISNQEMHALTLSAFEELGFSKEFFTHGLGHPIGFAVHDIGPTMNVKSPETELKAGMVLTIEPGLYCENDFGIRLEDDVILHADRIERLGDAPKEVLQI